MSKMKWSRAKFSGLRASSVLDEAEFQGRDAAARWLKEAEARRERDRKPKPKPARKSQKREHRRQGPHERHAGLVIYTDGACEPNPGKGGWAFVVYRDGREIHFECGGDIATTNNVMEMTGVLKAIEWLLSAEGRGFARILSDSQYVVKGCNEWRHGWKKRGWMRSVGRSGAMEPVKNVELWKRLDGLLMLAPTRIEWVKGHIGILGNERADELSNTGRSHAIAAARRMDMLEDQLRPPP